VKRLFFILLLLLVGIACKKSKMKNNCCRGEMSISPANYNSDSVAFYFPNAFTPDGDGINDLFEPGLSGIESIEFSIFKGRKEIFKSVTIGNWWNGEYKEKISAGRYKFEADIVTKHNETIELNGYFCSFTDDQQRRDIGNSCDDCTFSDMIDPVQGFIYSVAEKSPCN